MSKEDNLDVEWSALDGEGLVRVIPTDSFKTGFILTAEIGKTAEALGYFPEVTLSSEKVTIKIEPQDDGLDHKLAVAIDTFLNETAAK